MMKEVLGGSAAQIFYASFSFSNSKQEEIMLCCIQVFLPLQMVTFLDNSLFVGERNTGIAGAFHSFNCHFQTLYPCAPGLQQIHVDFLDVRGYHVPEHGQHINFALA